VTFDVDFVVQLDLSTLSRRSSQVKVIGDVQGHTFISNRAHVYKSGVFPRVSVGLSLSYLTTDGLFQSSLIHRYSSKTVYRFLALLGSTLCCPFLLSCIHVHSLQGNIIQKFLAQFQRLRRFYGDTGYYIPVVRHTSNVVVHATNAATTHNAANL